MTEIAPTATVDPTAQIGPDVFIGPGCVISPNVTIGDGCTLKANVCIGPGTVMGCNNRVFANCVLGEEPQIVGAADPPTTLIIGTDNTFRENVTINRGSPKGGGQTVIGNQNYLMIGAHLGHDCIVEDNTMIGNYCQISGHCKIESRAWINAFSGTHQFVTIGRFTYAGGLSGITSDQPPFVKVSGSYPCRVRGLNATGLQRAGVDPESIKALQQAYRTLFRRRGTETLAAALDKLAAQPDPDPNVQYLIDSIRRSFQHPMGRYLEHFRS